MVNMGKIVIKMAGFHCERCGHNWIPREETVSNLMTSEEFVNNWMTNDAPEKRPRVCPKCKSPYWDIPRKKVSAKSAK